MLIACFLWSNIDFVGPILDSIPEVATTATDIMQHKNGHPIPMVASHLPLLSRILVGLVWISGIIHVLMVTVNFSQLGYPLPQTTRLPLHCHSCDISTASRRNRDSVTYVRPVRLHTESIASSIESLDRKSDDGTLVATEEIMTPDEEIATFGYCTAVSLAQSTSAIRIKLIRLSARSLRLLHIAKRTRWICAVMQAISSDPPIASRRPLYTHSP
jgi:hypothetical protein